ncbi:TolC family protein [Hydrogenothermus marinus]|uniref:Outer membrane protein TolC n=1 Tax=Hydrogenothermus marinus TaxID=133270 RepID=A0A3M0B521_9AQUI|nr:TolC family protein [Hydrogenothermus marinus]RMA92490.1 outer membrane protein TolC [Hydrogenothermus marinus]
MRKNWLAVFSIFIITSFANAKIISLEEAINEALKNNFQIKAEEKLVKSKSFQYKASKGMRWPKIDLSLNFFRTNNPGYAMMNTLNQKRLDLNESAKFVDMTGFNSFPGVNFPNPSYPEVNNWQTKLQLQVPIYTGGKISTAIKIRKDDYIASKYQLERKKEETEFNVIKAYKGALLAKEGIKLAKEAYKTAKKHYEIAKKMQKEGLIVYADVLRAKIYMLNMEDKIAEAKANYLTAKKALLLAMGDTKTKPEDIDVEGNLKCEKLNKDVSYYQNIALAKRKDLLSFKKKLNIAKNMINITKADFLPTVGAFAFYEMDSKDSPIDPDGKWWGAGIGLNWNIFNGFQRFNQYKASKEQYYHYKNQIKGFEEYIKFKVYQAYNNFQTKYNKYLTQKENLKYAEEVLRTTEKNFQNQMVSMLDLIDTQTMRDKIKFDLSKATYECEIERLNLNYESGLINQ